MQRNVLYLPESSCFILITHEPLILRGAVGAVDVTNTSGGFIKAFQY